jgi:hypothetical protein
MNKKIFGIALVLLALAAVGIVFAQIRTEGVSWSWSGGDTITATSTDRKAHILSLAVTISQSGHEACMYPDIDVPAKGTGTWNVKQKVGASASIIGVSVTNCK